MIYNGTPHYFLKNLQGDIIAIANANGGIEARYSYDAWGVCTVTQDFVGIAKINPFRYRSYYFDEEIGLYYLQSRYYDPIVGRYVHPDEPAIILTGQILVGNNIYSYCQNNCINYEDKYGYFQIKIPTWALSASLDVLFIALNSAMYAGYLPFSSTIYTLSRSPFTRTLAKNLLTKQVVPCFVFGMLNPIMTIIRRVMWRFAGAFAIAASNYITTKIQNYVNNFLSFLQRYFVSIVLSILTWGGIISLFLDVADGSWDDNVTIRI